MEAAAVSNTASVAITALKLMVPPPTVVRRLFDDLPVRAISSMTTFAPPTFEIED